MHDVMSMAQAGHLDFGFLGAAQIDPFGNINTTVIGEHDHPTIRLPGSGGANDVGSFCQRTIIIMRQDRRKFAAQLDFLTTPGYLTGPGARERAGLPADTGPHRVITQLGVYGFDDATKTMRLLAVHPGVTVDEVQVNSSFPIPIAEPLALSIPPTDDDRRILREIDPTGLLIGR
jgi:3-oxoacid CoA-transferase subunit B/glutaconate CoA-transferase subunit B